MKSKVLLGVLIAIPFLVMGGGLYATGRTVPARINEIMSDTQVIIPVGMAVSSSPRCGIHLTDNGWQCYGTCEEDGFNCFIADDGYCGCYDGVKPKPEPDDYTKGMIGTVYVSNSRWSGAMGGQDGANAKCTQKALDAGLPGEWKAIISDSKQSAFDNIGKDIQFYRLDGKLVAMHRIDLFDSRILRQININELGDQNVNEEVWTGSTVAGLDSGENCKDWTWALNAKGTIGLSIRINQAWVTRELKDCSEMKRLYCVRTA